MQSRNVDLNSVSSNNTKGFTKNTRSASLDKNSDDYLDVVLRKEINLWFKKNGSSGKHPGIIEPANGYPNKDTSGVINLGYNSD